MDVRIVYFCYLRFVFVLCCYGILRIILISYSFYKVIVVKKWLDYGFCLKVTGDIVFLDIE